jgi:IclR family transcriptional regulator, mhp operon transcriptional activator
MPRVETIRGLERGLQVLQFLYSEPISSLHEIHVSTAISKPSLLRILNTLERSGMVTRRLADGRYRLRAFTDVVQKRDRHDRVAEAAAPVLIRLCEKVKWPSDLFVPAGDCMERRESSKPHSPFVFQAERRPGAEVGRRVGWLMTGVGRAYLACCPEKEREGILKGLRKHDRPEDWLARDTRRLERILAETRKRGYATRDPGFTGGSYKGPPYDDGLAAIATALCDGTRIYGSMNLLWIKKAFTVEEFAAQHLTDLQDAAREIVSSLRRSINRSTGS